MDNSINARLSDHEVIKKISGMQRKVKLVEGISIVASLFIPVGILFGFILIGAEKIDIIKYSPGNFMNEDFVRKCMILPKHDRISGSDYILGTYKGVKFTYCDLLMERVSGYG